ncbi:hypothetical protein G9F72_019325 [Clostridium estertheticum]|uniref:hypothetical protein n=1 Tax=Clostridium estertheticum TaxID=238834 RepID=UPI0013E99E5F|nr:hypothetical protein [Clostridium estertheticum]MBZ9688484.1 hypothetical protein [Clostridium estertheticum]
MEFDDMSIREQREQLYNEVWKEPIVTVAKRYGISDTGFRKRCKRFCIPLPPTGYWAKLNAGKSVVKKPKLPPLKSNAYLNQGYGIETTEDSKILKYIDTEVLSVEELKGIDSMDLLTPESKKRFLNWCSKIRVPKRIEKYDELITTHQSEIAYRKARDAEHKFKDITFSMFSNSKIKYQNNKAVIPINVSEKETGRAYRIMDTFIKSIRELEGRILVELKEEEDIAFIDLNVYTVSFIISEGKIKWRSFLSDSQQENITKSLRPSYEKVFNGELTIEFKEVLNFSERNKVPEVLLKFEDTSNTKLEEQLGEILIALCRLANKVKIYNIIKDHENELKHKEQRQLYEIEEENKRQLMIIEEERRKKENLVEGMENQMENWYKSQRLHKYADELEVLVATTADANTKEFLIAYIKLVRKKAESCNPIVDILNEVIAIGIKRLVE